MSRPGLRIKVCGLTNMADALACAAAGVDWLGLNFHAASPRKIDPALAAEIIAALPPSTQAVGLFVDRPPREVAETAGRLGLRIVQLHGSEPPEDLLELRHLEIVRAFRLSDIDSVERMTAFLRRSAEIGRVPDAVLIDAFVAGQPGGTGCPVPEVVVDRLAPLPRLILAGGLNPQNVAERVERICPWMVDVASGVESSPGCKDPSLVTAFVAAARGRLDRQTTATRQSLML